MDSKQVANGRAVLAAVGDWSAQQHFGPGTARLCALAAIMCGLTESGLRVYANSNVPESMSLPHDAVGSDHASVGIFQQQVPGWGTAADCMDPARSTIKFLTALKRQGQIPPYRGALLWKRVQAVQVSAFADGSNYRRNWPAAVWFCARYWSFWARRPR